MLNFPHVLFGLFGLSFLLSKSAFTLFYSVAIIFGLIQYPWKNIATVSKLEKVMMLLFPLAIFTNSFSLSGSAAAFDVLTRWTWPLIFFPVLYLYQNRKALDYFLKGLAVSLLGACLFSLYQFYWQYGFNYDTGARVASFWDILRWSYFCAIAVILLTAVFVKTNFLNADQRNKIFVLLVLSSVSMFLSNSRGPWLGCLLGVFLTLFMQKKSWKYFASLFSIIALILFFSSDVRDRATSIVAVEKQGDQVVMANKSNASRLRMWKVSLDLYRQVPIFGVGFNHSAPAIKSFMETQGEDYKAKYTEGDYSYTDQHSSYLSILLQFGGLYAVVLFGLFSVVIWKSRKNVILFPALACTLVVYLFYASIVSFEASVGFALISWLILDQRKT